MSELPHKISTLIYAFNRRDELLMLQRRDAPNAGLWSPFGGKLERATGESPHQCAAREAREETGLTFQPQDFHLAGMVAERAYEGTTHWLMFLFELKPRLDALPPPHEEGHFEFVPQEEVLKRDIPATDREVLWPLFLKHRRGFFSVSIACHPGEKLSWQVEEVRPS
jgi:8-oxo-dGTP diphosphatase